MTMGRRNRHRGVLTAVAVVALLGTAGAVSAAVERGAMSSFPCGDPKTVPVGKIYGKNRGTQFCNDHATATIRIAGRPTLKLKGGVCWKNRTNLEIGIGTLVINGRKKSDPSGLLITDNPPGDIIGDLLDHSSGKYHWTGPIKVKLAGKTKGTFASTSAGTSVNGKLTGSFTCKRVLDAPDQ
jgi:hypothetical protein